MTDQKNVAAKFYLWFNVIMIVLYTIIGVLLLFIVHFDSLPALNTKMIGGVLLLYASYRGYKIYKASAARTEPDQTNVSH